MKINEEDLESVLSSITKQVKTVYNDGRKPNVTNVGISENFISQILNNSKLKFYISRNYFGINTPIKHEYLPNINYSITFGENVATELLKIAKRTHEENIEIPYLLIGNVNDSEITIDIIGIDDNYIPRSREADYTTLIPAMEKLANDFKKNRLETKKCLILGHSHPDYGSYYNNFSLGDVDGNFSFSFFENSDFNKRLYGGLRHAKIVITGDYQIRVGLYDEKRKKFYTINNFQVITKDNQIYDWSKWVKEHQKGRTR